MKFCKSLLLLMIGAFVTQAFAFRDGYKVNYNQDRAGTYNLNFKVGKYVIETVNVDGVNYSKIIYDGNVSTSKKGYAEVPVLSSSLEISETRNVSMNIIPGEYKDINLKYPLLPSRGIITRNIDPATVPYEIAPESMVDDFYPVDIARKSEPFILRNVRGTNLEVFPFQYNAVQKVLRVYSDLEVRLEDNNEAPINALTSRGVYTPDMTGLYSKVFANYSDPKFDHELSQFGAILVINTSRDANAIQPYIDWKREKGFVVYQKEVATGTNVKDIIKQQYQEHEDILYVQLVGDWEDIKSDTSSDDNAPTDPFMGCVAGNDNYPDVIIGRFSVKNSNELTVIVNKVLTYEKDLSSDSGDWYKKGLGIASNEGAGQGDDSEADYDHMDVIRVNKLLPYTYDHVVKAYKTVNATQVANPVNEGLSIINYVGHGSHNSWATSGFSTSHIANLNNGNKMPFIWSVACVNGQFHVGGDCFAEAWLKKANGGAIVMLASSINQPWRPPMRGQDYMNDLLTEGYDYSSNPGSGTSTTAENHKTTFGSLSFNGSMMMVMENSQDGGLNTFKTWHIFGDASVQVRTDIPQEASLSNPQMVSQQEYTTKVMVGSEPAKNTMVAVSQNGNVVSAVTDNNGQVTLDLNQFTSGTAKLVVTGFNLKTKYEEVEIGGGNTPFLKVDTYTSEVEAGQTTNIDMKIKNVGAQASSDISVKLAIGENFSDANLVEIGNSSYDIPGSINSDGTHEITGKFDVKFSADLESGKMVPFVVTMTDNFTGKSVYTSNLSIKVLAPNITYEFDSNGLLLPNETHAVKYKISNTGTMAITDFKLEISEVTSTGSVIEPSTINVGTIDAESSHDAQFNLKIPDVNLGTSLSLKFNITASNGYTYEDVIETVIGVDKFEEDFENLTTENYGDDKQILKGDKYHWTLINANKDNVQWAIFEGDAHGGEKCMKISYVIPSHNDDYIVTPPLQIYDSNEASISFWTKQQSSTYPETYEVLVAEIGAGDSDPEAAMFTKVISTNSELSTGYEKQEISLADYKGKRIYIAIKNTTKDGYYQYVDDVVVSKGAVSYSSAIDEESSNIVKGDVLYQNYPNPFNPSTTIKFNLANAGHIKLMVYNARGQEVKTLVNSQLGKGVHNIKFDASSLNSGVYYYKMQTKNRSLMGKMLLIK